MCGQMVWSCNPSNDWLVTQYISKTAEVTYALTITVALQGDTSSCSSCNSNAVKVYYYPSVGPIASGAQLIADNYNFVDSVLFGMNTKEKSVTFALGGEYDRFYIAIVAENTCPINLRRLLVSYEVCPTKTVGLVVYPGTPIGSSSVMTNSSCKNNADVSLDGSLSITCNANGTFSGSPSCSCIGGHIQSGEACDREITHTLYV